MTMTSDAIAVGDTVWVYDVNARRGDGPAKATVVKVGRKLCTLRFGGHYEQVFRLEEQRANDDYGHQWFKTEAEKVADERRQAAVAVLRKHGLEFAMGRHRDLSTETVEAIARLLEEAAG